MPVTTPEALHALWIDEVNRGNLDAVVALYEPTAAFAVQPGQVVHGISAIREALAGLFALAPCGTLENLAVVGAGDLALLVSRWSLTGTGSDGEPVSLGGQTADVARRQVDGTWRLAIDNPWGDAVVAS